MKKTYKQLFSISICVLVLTFSFFSAAAAKTKNTGAASASVSSPVIFQSSVLVDGSSEKFDIGFTTVHFKNNFTDTNMLTLPQLFNVKIYAENGKVFIEFDPDAANFVKDVKIHANKYNGYIYDVAAQKNIYVEIPAQNLDVSHFSRYCFAL